MPLIAWIFNSSYTTDVFKNRPIFEWVCGTTSKSYPSFPYKSGVLLFSPTLFSWWYLIAFYTSFVNIISPKYSAIMVDFGKVT